MLFDLRSRGRRRTVQGLYLWLAILMGGGLVLFGIGGATSGGLLDAFKGGGGSSTPGYEQTLKRAEKAVAQRPNDPAALAQLAHAHYISADYDQNTHAFTPEGRGQLAQAAAAWDRYLALNPPHPDPSLAAQMVSVYAGPGGLGQLSKAVDAEQIVADARPSAGTYGQLAQLAYAAGQTRTGDLAAAKAVDLASPSQKATVRAQLKAVKQQASASAAGTTTAPATTTTAPPATTSTTPAPTTTTP